VTDFQPGDRVAHYEMRGPGPAIAQLTTVDRLTATQIVTEAGRKYRRTDGRLIGDRYAARLLPAADKRVRATVARQELDRLRFDLDSALAGFRGTPEEAAEALRAVERLVADARAQLFTGSKADASPDLEKIERKGRFDALMEAREKWRTGDWANAPRRDNPMQERIANGQYVTDWLTKRAELELG
jgi:hypothetical protein